MNLYLYKKKNQQIKITWTCIFSHSLLLDISEKYLPVTCVVESLCTQYENILSIATNTQQRFSTLLSERKKWFSLEKCLFGLLLLKYYNFPAKIPLISLVMIYLSLRCYMYSLFLFCEWTSYATHGNNKGQSMIYT